MDLHHWRRALQARALLSELQSHFMVEEMGIEPTTSWMQIKRSPKLSYTPKIWRKRCDSNTWDPCRPAGFQDQCNKPTLPHFLKLLVEAPGNAPGGSEDTGFTVLSISLVGYASIIFHIHDVKKRPIFFMDRPRNLFSLGYIMIPYPFYLALHNVRAHN